MPTVSLELINTNKGITAIHRHAGDDPRYCFGWVRSSDGTWRQRHMSAYGARCPKCRRDMPLDKELEDLFNACGNGDVSKLLFIELPK
jgi:hypothetical protein